MASVAPDPNLGSQPPSTEPVRGTGHGARFNIGSNSLIEAEKMETSICRDGNRK